MLDRDELTRRLKALRMLRGYSQPQLEAQLKEVGLTKTDLGKLERKDPDKPLTKAMLRQLVDILRAPEAYFIEPDLDKVLFKEPSDETDLGPGGAIGRDAEDFPTSGEGHG